MVTRLPWRTQAAITSTTSEVAAVVAEAQQIGLQRGAQLRDARADAARRRCAARRGSAGRRWRASTPASPKRQGGLEQFAVHHRRILPRRWSRKGAQGIPSAAGRARRARSCVVGEVDAHQRRRPPDGVEQGARRDQPAFVEQGWARRSVSTPTSTQPNNPRGSAAKRQPWPRAPGAPCGRAPRQQALHTRSAWRRSRPVPGSEPRRAPHRGRGQRGDSSLVSIERSTSAAGAARKPTRQLGVRIFEKPGRRRCAPARPAAPGGRCGGAKVGVGVVLDDGEVVRLGELQHRCAPTAG